MFKIGDIVYNVEEVRYLSESICPDCGGTKHLHVTLFNGEELDIPCETCKNGYHGPRGKVSIYSIGAYVREYTIRGIVTTSNGSSYNLSYWSTYQETCPATGAIVARCSHPPTAHVAAEELYVTKDIAELKASEQQKILDQENAARAKLKIKDHKSWAWHVSYHR